MRNSLRRRVGVVVGVLAMSALLGVGRPASAQNNTYRDFPYNQGSLFYRYKPYRPDSASKAPATAPRTTWRGWRSRRAAQPAAPVYQSQPRVYAPAPATVYAQPPRAYYTTPARPSAPAYQVYPTAPTQQPFAAPAAPPR